ncbi:MAG: DEAD/DEAH box helicase [Paracoccaceae bacterium]|nr:DEAD/DEAH box helicase [Paracoccaceae bacterium]
MTKFSDLKLDPKVLKAIEDAGYETPTPIQAGAIPPALEGRDVLGIAQTGTGKTASFTLPMITLLAKGRARARMPRSLVLCPTRELAAQVAENFDTYTKYHKLTKALLIGGVSFKEQEQLIDRGVDVLIATPGRLLDHFERGKLLLTGVQIMVVDEADRMLDMGFIPDIERIFSLTPFTRQTLFFSATMAPEIERITNTFLSAPERIEVARQASASTTITQGVVMFKASRKDKEASEKRQLLRTLIDAEGEKCKNAIIFCNRKTDVDIVAKSLKKYGYDAAPIHGDLEQSQRMRTLDGFRDGTLRFLVASDVAARGLDIPNVSHVFNFDVPSHAEDYVHRIGRTGRAGRTGTAIMICTGRDDKNFADVERLIQTEIPRLDNPLQGVILPDSDDEAEGETRQSYSRSRSRGGRGRSGDKPAPKDKPEEAKADAPREDKPREDRPRDERPRDDRPRDDRPREDKPREDRPRDAKPREERARDNKPREDRGAEGRSDERRDRSRGGQGRDSGRDNGPKVVGMGDHLPSFIALSFDERRTG